IIECEGGHVVVPDYKSAIAYDKDGSKMQDWKGGGDNGSHMGNFIKAVHSRKIEDLYADIEEGHLSSALCHTGNISYRLGAKKNPDELKETLKVDKGMVESFKRMVEHLTRNDMDIRNKDKIAMDVPLMMKTNTDKFIGT